jgi:hypothetical protein
MGVVYFAAIDGDWADDPDELAAALRADWPDMKVWVEGSAYRLEMDGRLGTLETDGKCISFKHGEQQVVELAAWWRARMPADVKLAVFDDSVAIPVYVEPGDTASAVRDRVDRVFG